MKNRRFTEEEMRYKVPEVCNRFWQVHARFIAGCILATVIMLMICFSFVIVKGIQRLAPRPTIVFLCSVDDYSAITDSTEIFTDTVDLIFAAYDERFKPIHSSDDTDSISKYDFSSLGSAMDEYDNPEKDVLCVVLTATKSLNREYSYKSFGLEDGAAVSVDTVKRVIAEVMSQ